MVDSCFNLHSDDLTLAQFVLKTAFSDVQTLCILLVHIELYTRFGKSASNKFQHRLNYYLNINTPST